LSTSASVLVDDWGGAPAAVLLLETDGAVGVGRAVVSDVGSDGHCGSGRFNGVLLCDPIVGIESEVAVRVAEATNEDKFSLASRAHSDVKVGWWLSVGSAERKGGPDGDGTRI